MLVHSSEEKGVATRLVTYSRSESLADLQLQILSIERNSFVAKNGQGCLNFKQIQTQGRNSHKGVADDKTHLTQIYIYFQDYKY